jgi:hypothetical protein
VIPAFVTLGKPISRQLLENGITTFVVDGVNKIIVTPDEDVIACGADETPDFEIFKVERGSHVSWRVEIRPGTHAAA